MVWRTSLLLVFAAVLVCTVDLHGYQRYESGTVVGPHDSNYLIKCEGIEFRSDATVVSIRLIDSRPSPQFETFRLSLPRDSSAYLELPTSTGKKATRLAFLHFEDQPAVLYHPLANNKTGEVAVLADFQSLPHWTEKSPRPRQVKLKFPGF